MCGTAINCQLGQRDLLLMLATIIPHPSWPVLPCPECGERPAVVQPELVDHVERFTVVCVRCRASSPVCGTGAEAQAEWNACYGRSVGSS